ncbi:hypothetical protein L1S33_12765, partial [Tenacibaculum sp. K20-16]|nr:hypothetical protein [Tenacibaculum aquimarinum]
MKNKIILIFVLSIAFNQFSYSQISDCSNAIAVCETGSQNYTVDGIGTDDFPGQSASGCLGAGGNPDINNPNTVEGNSIWFRFKASRSGEVGFNIIPTTPRPGEDPDDWDFALYGPNASCGSLGNPVNWTGAGDCGISNYDGLAGNGTTGAGNPPAGAAGSSYTPFFTVNAGEEYLLLINSFQGGNDSFTLEWTGSLIDDGGGNPLDCSIVETALGPDQTVCETTPPSTVTLDATPTTGTAASYEWFLDTNDGMGFQPLIPAQTNATLTINNNVSGNYQVKITDTNSQETEHEVEITFVPPPTATQPTSIEICDTDGAGETFDLTTQTATIIGTQIGVDVKYYTSLADANANTGEITSFNFTTNSVQQFWARVFNTAIEDDLSCDTITDFEVTYAIEPTPATATDIIVCDDAVSGSSTDGIYTFSQFIDKDAEILGTLSATDYSVSYHTTQSGAQTDATTDVIDKNTTFTNTTSYNQEIFVRVENTLNTMCTVDQSFFLRVLDLPVANPVSTIEKCDASGGTTATFNFETEVTPDVLLTQSTTDFEVLYFETSQAAIDNVTGTNITGNYINTAANQTIYVRIHNVSNPDLCPQFTNFQITVFSTPILNTTFEDTTHCENDTFNITIDSTADTFIWQVSTDNGINWNDVVADVNYSNETSTALTITDAPSSFDTNQYRVRMFRSGSSCEATSNAITLTINSLPVLNSIELKQCDDDTDGFSAFNLTEANELISSNYTNETFVYYSDAAYTSVITNDTAYTNTNTPNDVVYVRVTDNTTLCSNDIAVNLLVTASQVPSTFSENINNCDDFLDINGNDNANNDDSDGVTTFNFEYVRATIEAMFTTQVVTVTFYRNEADALAETNEITDATNYRNIGYPNTQQIYVRVDNNLDNGCLGLGPYINLNVSPTPVANDINPDNEYELCDDFVDGDGSNGVIQSFDLESQTAAILGSQDPLAYTVTYHDSSSDATSG